MQVPIHEYTFTRLPEVRNQNSDSEEFDFIQGRKTDDKNQDLHEHDSGWI